MKIWLLTDGKAGDLQQCRGVANAVGADQSDIVEVTVAPRVFYALAMPHSGGDPRDKNMLLRVAREIGVPDIVIASGRRAVPYLRYIKSTWHECFSVFLKDPRTKNHGADLVWVPDHDHCRLSHVMSTATAPHVVSQQLLQGHRADPSPQIASLPTPRLAVVIGGNSSNCTYTNDEIEQFCSHLETACAKAASVMITTSRRTDAKWQQKMVDILRRPNTILHTPGSGGANPYTKFLAAADAIIVTGDSHNMVSEALACGVPVLVYQPAKIAQKLGLFANQLQRDGLIKLLSNSSSNQLEFTQQLPVDSTQQIAQEILRRLSGASKK